jgi:hypothetical protein
MDDAAAQSQPPGPPSLASRAWNLAAAVAAFVADGCQTVERETYEQRLRTCDTCDQRQEDFCLKCGCYLPIKAKWRLTQCPLGKWPAAGESSA